MKSVEYGHVIAESPLIADQVAWGNLQLLKHGLVAWTSGNVSARFDKDYIYIKPSGVLYEELTGLRMVRVGMDGKDYGDCFDIQFSKPSTDTASHLYIYNHRPDVNAICHTHSPYATAFAALGRPIPCCLTGMADEFGGPIACGRYAEIGGEDIGMAVLDTLTMSEDTAKNACLLKNHGVFTIGKTVEAAVKAAVMIEDVAKTTFLALQLHQLPSTSHLPQIWQDGLELTKERIKSNYERYHTSYGQQAH